MKKQRGITLVALVVTIVVLLILAGVTLSLVLGKNGIITITGSAKSKQSIAEEKEILEISFTEAKTIKLLGEINSEEFQNALDNNKRNTNPEVIEEDDIAFIVRFNNSNRYYTVDKDGTVEQLEVDEGAVKKVVVKCINSQNTILAEKEYTALSNNFSKTAPKIEGYVSVNEKIEADVSTTTTITAKYYLLCNDDTTLLFTGLDESGNIITDENSIVSYMVGDGTTDGNGFKEGTAKNIESIIEIPEAYNGKSVTKIGKNSFYGARKNNKINYS